MNSESGFYLWLNNDDLCVALGGWRGDDNNDDDDDNDCQFVDCPNIHEKAMLVAHTGAVSLPDDKQQKNTDRENDEEIGGDTITGVKTSESWVMVIQSLVWKQVSLEFPAESWRRL